MVAKYLKKLHDKAIKQGVNDLVLTSIVDTICKIGVIINRDSLYKHRERD